MSCMTVCTAQYARVHLDEVMDTLALSHRPITIMGKTANAVLINEADWQAMQNALVLGSDPKLNASIVAGLRTPMSRCHKRLRW